MLETERLILRLMEEKDETDIVRWRNQKEIMDNLFSFCGITVNEHRAWFEKYLKDNSRIEFVISVKESNKNIGTIGLSSIDHKNQKAEYGIMIGEKTEWGKGFAKEASIALIYYAFDELNLQRIYLKVLSNNLAAINLYKNLGFFEEGLLRCDVFKNGEYKDVKIMSIIRSEWKFRNV